MQRLAGLEPRTFAVMHGSSFAGDGRRALKDVAVVIRETHGQGDDPAKIASGQ
jgi:hypothetical protein